MVDRWAFVRRGGRRRWALGVAVLSLVVVGVASASGFAAAVGGGDSPAPGITLPTWRSTYAWPAGDGYAGWEQRARAADDDAYGFAPGLAGHPGLWVWPVGGREYGPGDAEWVLRAPGTTRIARATVSVAYTNKLYAHHCLRIALRSDAETRDVRLACKPPAPPASQDNYELRLADPVGAPTAKELSVEILVPACEKNTASACSKWIPVKDPLKDGAFVQVKSADLTLVDDDDPVVTPSKAFFELDGTYIDGRQTYPLRIDSTDAGAGVTRIDVEHTGWPGPQPPLAEHAVECDAHHHTAALGARICPPADAIELDVDTRPMPEGTRHFRASTPDVAGNIGDHRWTVIIDRTPPTPPQSLRFTTPEEGSAQAAWDAAEDPVLPDGTPGSGVKHYQARHRISGGGWSDWETLDRDARLTDEVYDQPAGTRVDFQVRAIDAVGNVGDAAEVAGEVFGTAPQVSAAGRLIDLNGGYVGSEQTAVTIAADDTGRLAAGTRRLWLERRGTGEIGGADAGCTPRTRPDGWPWKAACPLTASHQVSVDTAALPEGANDFDVHAVDRPHNERAGAGFRVLVDHTPPPTVGGVHAELDTDSGDVDVDWSDTNDPALPDGNPGSGLSHYSYRVQRDGGPWTDWTATRDSGFSLPGSHDGEQLRVQIRAYDAVGNTAAAWEGDLVAVDPDAAGSDDGPRPGEDAVDALGTSAPEYQGQESDFSPGVVPDVARASTRAASFGVAVTEPSDEAHASVAASTAAPRCGRNSYDGDGPQDTFRIKFGQRGETDDGDPYYQFHLHYQVRLPFRDDVAWTWLAATRTLPDGRFDPSPYDDSRTRFLRDPVHWKPYYAHFLRLKVKPGSLITYWGRWQYKAPVPVPGGLQTGGTYWGSCVAWLNS